MTLVNSILLILVIASAITGLMIILVKTKLISPRGISNIKVLYSSALIICLLLTVIAFSTKLLSTNEGKKWLDSFSNSGDCEKVDRPYWCDL